MRPGPVQAASGHLQGRSRRRSMVRPLLAWVLTIAAFTPLYLGQRPAAYRGEGAQWHLPGWPASLSWDGAPAWLSAGAGSVWDGAAWLSGAIGGLFSTGPCVHGTSQPVAEAVFLAAKNALMYVPWKTITPSAGFTDAFTAWKARCPPFPWQSLFIR